jgi:hypothetical protein
MRGVMFLGHTKRKKDGKEHRYWSIVENRRVGGGRVVQRPLLYLGEINDSQELAWRKSIAVLEESAAAPRSLSLFPEDRCEGVLPDASIVRLKLNELRLRRPRQWGGGRLVGGGCRAGGDPQALPLSRSVARTQASAVRPFGRTLARPVQYQFRCVALRFDQYPGLRRGRLYFEADPPFPEGDKRRHGRGTTAATACT